MAAVNLGFVKQAPAAVAVVVAPPKVEAKPMIVTPTASVSTPTITHEPLSTAQPPVASVSEPDIPPELTQDVEPESKNMTEEQKKHDLEMEQEAVNVTKSIIGSVKVTDEDRVILSQDTIETFDLQMQLEGFLNKKLDITNDNGDIEKLPTGIDLLDTISGGGFGVGTFTMIVGQPGTFKSTLLGQLVGNNQRRLNGKMLAVYYDTETAMTQKRLSQLGVNRPQIKPYDDITIENLFKTIEAFIAFKEAKKMLDVPSLICWDSIANTTTEKERTTDDINSTMGLKQKLLSQLLPRYLPKMKKWKISVIAINQLRDKMEIGQFAPASDLQHMSNQEIPGGKAVKFNAFHLLLLKNRGDLKEEQYGFRGIKLEASFIKNKFFSPHIPVNLLVDFTAGVDNFYTNYQMLIDNDRLQSGAWNKLVILPKKTFRTKDAKVMYSGDAEFKNAFDAEVQSVLKTQYIDKNT